MKERDLFLAALEINDPAARRTHLHAECAGDAALLSRVEALLDSHEDQSQFLNTPAVQQMAAALDPGLDATIALGDDSTREEVVDPTIIYPRGPARMTPQRDDTEDENNLGYLEPSSKPESLGRLAHYEVLEVIGRGAFGTVLRAFDEKLHRVVAIKVMAPELASTSPARRRFLREAQASAAVRHEHVVGIHAVEEKPLPYIVMDYIPGETLQKRLDERGPLDVPTVLMLGRQIAEGLAAAHSINLIHRDIKPSNILLETSVLDRIKITDFGLARAADDASLTQSGMIAGTPMYMAPEQALGKKLDQRADLFSFGSVLYQMVSGRPPFRAPSALAVLKRVADEPPRPIQEIIPETPDWLCGIIAKLHAKDPDDRFQSAREVADLLADCEAKLRAKQEVKSILPVAKPTFPKWVAAAVLLVPVLALALTETAGVTHLLRGRSPDREPITQKNSLATLTETTRPEPLTPSLPEAPSPVPTEDAITTSEPGAHDAWIKATALLPLKENAMVLLARLKERLPGFEDALVRIIPRMAPDRQALIIAVLLQDRNPLFDGEVSHKSAGGLVTSLGVPSLLAQDLTPLQSLAGLREFTGRDTLGYDNQATRDAAVLRSLESLETINGKPVGQFWKDAEAKQAEFQEWLQLVPTLTAPQQVSAVVSKLKERNPGLEGPAKHTVEEGVITQFTFTPVKGQDIVTDLSPMRALASLTSLNLWGCSGLVDLEPLRGLPLTRLTIGSYHARTQVRDLEPLRGMKLTELQLYHCQVDDLGPLQGMPLTLLSLISPQLHDCEALRGMRLTRLSLDQCFGIKDFTPLQGMPLTWLALGRGQFKDIELLKDMPLAWLSITDTQVQDLEVIKGMPLKMLQIYKTGITNLKPLDGMELEEIRLTPKNIAQGLETLRDMKSLKTIGIDSNQSWPAAEFWERYDKGEFTN